MKMTVQASEMECSDAVLKDKKDSISEQGGVDMKHAEWQRDNANQIGGSGRRCKCSTLWIWSKRYEIQLQSTIEFYSPRMVDLDVHLLSATSPLCLGGLRSSQE